MNNIQSNSQVSILYKPSEIIGIFNTILAQQRVNAQVVYLRGVYLASGRASYGGYFYDTLRDEDRQEEITLVVTQSQRESLKSGNLVNVGGVIDRHITVKGQIQLNLNVSRIEVVQDQVVDENEIKRIELRKKKASLGFKNVDSILEQLLYTDQRPRIALIYASSSITDSDFNLGVQAAKAAIDFVEHKDVSFAKTYDLINKLKTLDSQNYTALALVRGGGSGIEVLDNIEVLNAIVELKTPFITAIGHVEEKLFIKQIADKDAAIPNNFGHYLKDMVESVSEKKTKSRAVLTEQIKKQFQEQLVAGQKQNAELQKKLEELTKTQAESDKKHNEQVQALTKAQEDATKKHNEQVIEAQKQNKALQDQLKGIQKVHEEQMKTLTEAQKQQNEQQKKQQDELTKNLAQMQQANGELQKNLQNITNQNTQSLKDLANERVRTKDLEKQLAESGKGNSNLWMIAAIVLLIILLAVLFFK